MDQSANEGSEDQGGSAEQSGEATPEPVSHPTEEPGASADGPPDDAGAVDAGAEEAGADEAGPEGSGGAPGQPAGDADGQGAVSRSGGRQGERRFPSQDMCEVWPD